MSPRLTQQPRELKTKNHRSSLLRRKAQLAIRQQQNRSQQQDRNPQTSEWIRLPLPRLHRQQQGCGKRLCRSQPLSLLQKQLLSAQSAIA